MRSWTTLEQRGVCAATCEQPRVRVGDAAFLLYSVGSISESGLDSFVNFIYKDSIIIASRE
jgi:hypothetical protein